MHLLPWGSYLCSQCYPIICKHGGCPGGSYLEIRLRDLDSCPLGSPHLTLFHHLWQQRYLPPGQISCWKRSSQFLKTFGYSPIQNGLKIEPIDSA